MTERGMIFNAEMVRAILDGRKTQTRRPLKQATGPSLSVEEESPGVAELSWLYGDGPGYEVHEHVKLVHCPYGKPGDRIWVRETWARYNIDHDSHDMAYRATTPEDWPEGGRWRPSIHMPRWASRILLEISDVRVERLNSISQADAIAEGAPPSHPSIDVVSRHFGYPDFSRSWFGQTWQSIYGEDSWQANPWVWVIEFKRIEGADHEAD